MRKLFIQNILKRKIFHIAQRRATTILSLKRKIFFSHTLFFFFSLNKIQENISAFSWKMNLDWTFGQKGDFTYHKTMLSFIETSYLYFHNWKKKKILPNRCHRNKSTPYSFHQTTQESSWIVLLCVKSEILKENDNKKL